jgi:hypothetical protein
MMVARLFKKTYSVYGSPKVHNLVHKGPPLELIVSHLKRAHTLAPYLFKINVNTIYV